MEKPYIWKANPEDNQDCLTSSGSDLLDPTCNRVLPHAFPSRLSLTSLLHYSLLLPLFFLLVQTFTLKARLPALRGFSVRVQR
ncbi:unnamed protein product [Gadus morhua 'NCC']